MPLRQRNVEVPRRRILLLGPGEGGITPSPRLQMRKLRQALCSRPQTGNGVTSPSSTMLGWGCILADFRNSHRAGMAQTCSSFVPVSPGLALQNRQLALGSILRREKLRLSKWRGLSRALPRPQSPLHPAPTFPGSSAPSPLEEDFRGPSWGCQTASDECFFHPSPADLDNSSYLRRQGGNSRAWQPVTSGRRCPASAWGWWGRKGGA